MSYLNHMMAVGADSCNSTTQPHLVRFEADRSRGTKRLQEANLHLTGLYIHRVRSSGSGVRRPLRNHSCGAVLSAHWPYCKISLAAAFAHTLTSLLTRCETVDKSP